MTWLWGHSQTHHTEASQLILLSLTLRKCVLFWVWNEEFFLDTQVPGAVCFCVERRSDIL